VWSVICFVVRAGFRRQGVTHPLLDGAGAYARSNGAPMVEGYPVAPGDGRINSAAAHVGTVGLFRSAGFEVVAETRSRAARKPRWLMRKDLG
jgi:GNAT superfamily N-acetyltransferase